MACNQIKSSDTPMLTDFTGVYMHELMAKMERHDEHILPTSIFGWATRAWTE
jgi:hypothetical protein